MYSFKPILVTLSKRLGLVFAIYTLCRILFFLYNKSSFQGLEFGEFIAITFFGLRFDVFSIFATNSLFILMSVLPFRFYYSKIYQALLKYIFIICNLIPILFNIVDIAYFPFIQKRSTIDTVNLLFNGEVEILKLLPYFLKEYWILVLFFILLAFLLVKLYNYVSKSNAEKNLITINVKSIGIHAGMFLLVGGLTVLGIRGGLQKIPIVLLDAANYSKPQYIPIVLNTPFSIIKSTELRKMEELNLFPENTSQTYVNPIHPPDTGNFKGNNICVLVLESFSKEFTALGKKTSYTPFLDSLMKCSTVFPNAYANGKTSSEGICSAIASIPSYMEDKYIESIYSNNIIETLPNLLKKKGYSSTFFHGGTNGTMNFNSFAKIAGFDNYYGRSEYNNDANYDGQWGIWDHAFLKKVPEEMGQLKAPFFTTIFTLSSHNPYKIPPAYKGKFPKGNLEIIETIGYADNALRIFFNEAKKQKWFDNTLFIVTADHTAVSEDKFFSNQVGQHSIPIFMFKNNEPPAVSNKSVQQIDIMPTILDYLNYDAPYYSLGESMLSQKNNPVIYFSNPYYYLISDSLVGIISNYKFNEIYNFKTDSFLQNSIAGKNKIKEDEFLNFAKWQIQIYTNDIIRNKMYSEGSTK